jgi:riboflavin biosynthesis pyrimidine reductase
MDGRFEAFADRKMLEATSAELLPFRTELAKPPPGLTAIGNAWSRALFDGPFYQSPAAADRPSTSLVFVQTADGNTVARNPASLGGGETDKHLIYEGLARVAADAVLTGAETIRGAQLVFSVWHPELVSLRSSLGFPRHPVQVVATLAGLRLADALIYNVPVLRVILLTVAAAVEMMRRELNERPWITPLVMSHRDDLASAFRSLNAMGIHRVSAIGGRTIARALIDAGLVDELYLTTAARPGGEPDTPLYPTPLAAETILRKREPTEGVIFEHKLLK